MRRVAILAVVVPLAAVLALAVWPDRGAGAGPYGETEGGFKWGVDARAGQTVTTDYALSGVLSQRAVLLAVRPLHPEDAREVTLRYGAQANMTGQTLWRSGWHLRKWHARAVPGFVVPPGHLGVLEIGMSSRVPGAHRLRGFVVDYRVGGTTYSAPQRSVVELDVVKKLP
jgi:hypothetical protein